MYNEIEQSILTGGKKRSASGSASARGVWTLWGAGEAVWEGLSFLTLTVVDVDNGGDGGVWTGAVEVVEAELGGASCAGVVGVCSGRGEG
jgi:hypothetical protein